jgi:hypothetical protein
MNAKEIIGPSILTMRTCSKMEIIREEKRSNAAGIRLVSIIIIMTALHSLFAQNFSV